VQFTGVELLLFTNDPHLFIIVNCYGRGLKPLLDVDFEYWSKPLKTEIDIKTKSEIEKNQYRKVIKSKFEIGKYKNQYSKRKNEIGKNISGFKPWL